MRRLSINLLTGLFLMQLIVPAEVAGSGSGGIETPPVVTASDEFRPVVTASDEFRPVVTASEGERAIIEGWLQQGLALGDVPVPDLIAFYGRKQLGIPYVGGLLEVPPVETLVVTLQGSDCVLYVEYTLALTVTTLTGSLNYADFLEHLALFRYYDGSVDGYASRQHYFSDWLRSNEQKDLLEIMFQQEGSGTRALPRLSALTFMSRNRNSYRQLAASDSLFARISQREAELNSLPGLIYIPEARIHEFESDLQTGDIVGFVSTLDGLDIAHTALVKREGNRVGFYHASTTGSVIEDPKTVASYTIDRRNVKGIVVARLRRP
jgi:hypothetical protein